MPMPFRIILEELRGMRERPRKHMNKSHIAPEGCLPHHHSSSLSQSSVTAVCGGVSTDGEEEEEQQSPWAHLPTELLFDIIKRLEVAGASWPARRDVVVCAAVCRSWRDIVGEIVKTPELSGLITFPISLKQPGPRDHPIQCFIKRERSTSTYRLYLGLSPALSGEDSKLLLAAKKIRRATCWDFVISLIASDFSRASSNYIGKLRSNFLGTKFTIFDSQPPLATSLQQPSKISHRWIHSRQVSPTLTLGSYPVASVAYELNVLRTRGPRRLHSTMFSIPVASLQEGGAAPTPTTFKKPVKNPHPTTSSKSLLEGPHLGQWSQEPLMLKNKAPRWHEQLQCWCLNFRGRVTVASVKNFQLVADVTPEHGVPSGEQEKVILQFGKIGKDIFTMDYRYPLSAFQAFAICLSSFDTKPACE